MDALLGDREWLEEDADTGQHVGQGNDVGLILDVELGEVAMEQVDPALVRDRVRREVLEPDAIPDRGPRPSHCRDDEAARPDRRRDIGSDLEDFAQVLVADGQEILARWRGPELPGDDLAIGAVDADLEHPDEHASAAGHVVDDRPPDVAAVQRVRRARVDGERADRRLHRPHHGAVRDGVMAGTSRTQMAFGTYYLATPSRPTPFGRRHPWRAPFWERRREGLE